MWWELFNKAIEHYPQIGGYALLIIIVAYLSIKIYKFYSTTTKVCNSFDGISEKLNKISKGLEMTNTILLEKKFIDNSCYSESYSPVQANPLGRDLYKESGAEQLMNSGLSDKLLKELEENYQQDTALEVQNNALRILLEEKDGDEFRILQKFAYNNPKFRDNPLTYTDILYIMSLELRNKYLMKHPDINKE